MIVLIVFVILFFIFGLNDIFANFFSGIIVRTKNHFHIGEHIKIKEKNVEGTIIGINLLNVNLETDKEEFIFIPNMILFKCQVIKTKNPVYRRIRIKLKKVRAKS